MAWVNETGGTTLTDFAFNTRAGDPGWFPVFPQGGQIVTDSLEPESPPNCLEVMRFPNSTGNSPVPTFSINPLRDEMWVGFTLRTSDPFEGQPHFLTKVSVFWNDGGVGNVMLFWFYLRAAARGGPYQLIWQLEPSVQVSNSHLGNGFGDPNQTWNLFGNVRPGSFSIGGWHRLEAYLKTSTNQTSRDGVLRWWLDGNLIGDYPNVNYANTRFSQFQFAQSWDSNDPTQINPYWYRYGHCKLKYPSGTVVNPNPPPSINSFTPTSGQVGTPLTIVGSNFAQTLNGNSVTLNQTACTILGATTTQISTAVPNGATTGPIRVTTANGTATSTTNFTVTTPPTGTGLLTGSRSIPSATTLSNEGTVDWAHWGLTDANSFNSRSGASTEISDVTVSGTGSKGRYADNPTAYTWIGGTPTASATATTTGIFTTTGFTFTVPADTTERILRVYAGCFNGTMRLQALLTDNSAAGYTDSTFTGPVTAGGGNAVWALRYRAGEPGQHNLAVTVSLISSGGNVQLQAASLQPANAPVEAITLSPSSLTIEEETTGSLSLTINPARSTATVVTITNSDDEVVTVSPTVTVPANSMQVVVPVTAVAAGTATITATLGSNMVTSSVTVIPAPDEPEEPTGPATPSLNLYTSFLDVYRWM
jgi:hypothetical protein